MTKIITFKMYTEVEQQIYIFAIPKDLIALGMKLRFLMLADVLNINLGLIVPFSN